MRSSSGVFSSASPPESLLRCRAVSRAWHAATSTGDFLLAHHVHQPTVPLLHSHDHRNGITSLSLDIVPLDDRAGVADTGTDQLKSVARLVDHRFFRPVASCDGLLVLSVHTKCFVICNLATRQHASLPQVHGFLLLGIYLNNPTGEYRLLYWEQELVYDDEDALDGQLGTPGFQDVYHVLTLGSPQPPREIHYEWQNEVIFAIVPIPVLFRGSLHWPLEHHEDGSTMIMVFNTTTESFRKMQSPVLDGLFETDGMLAMYSVDDEVTHVDIWVLKDYENEEWIIKCRIELPVEGIMMQCGTHHSSWYVVAMSWDEDVLVLVQFGEWLLQIDVGGKLVRSFYRESLRFTHHQLKQSLVPHTFFPRLEDYVVNDLPFV
ncbi:uncharacterized protein [Aegilops tauschii subsp. strangulata]|uniref:F-box associated beta-propeller type 3 domain-containing protein n=1 Tax=Aegilops tauschii TaxID=37682 RepID=M8D169_AEGTA|nr:uncharacterized protein LOC109751192 [Aegilops tauschii subsp. strangulata]